MIDYLNMISIPDKTFTVIVKPNARENKILGYDAERKAYRISIAAPAKDNKANKELIKFLHKQTGKQARIVKGLTSRIKVVELN